MDRSLLLLQSLVDLPLAQLVVNTPHVLGLVIGQRLLQIASDGDATRRQAQTVLAERWFKRIDSLLDPTKSTDAAAATVSLATPPKKTAAAASASASAPALSDSLRRWAGAALLGATVSDASAPAIKARYTNWFRALKSIITDTAAVAEHRVTAIEAYRALLIRAHAWSDTRQLTFEALKWLFGGVLNLSGADESANASASGKKQSKSSAAAASAIAAVGGGGAQFLATLSHEQLIAVLRVLIDICTVFKHSVKNVVPRLSEARVLTSLLDHFDTTVRRFAVRACACVVQSHNVALSQSSDPNVLARADRINHWSECITVIVSTLHTVFEDASDAATVDQSIVPIGVDTTSAGADEKRPATLLFAPLPLNDSISRSAVIARRFSALCALLCELLNGAMDSDHRIPLASTLGLIERVVRCEVSVSAMKSFTGKQLSALAFASLLPGMQEEVMDVLNVLCSVLRQHLLPYANAICAIVLEALRATAYDNRSHGFALPQLRRSAYAVCAVAVQLFGAGVLRWLTGGGGGGNSRRSGTDSGSGGSVFVQLIHDALTPIQDRKSKLIRAQASITTGSGSGGGGAGGLQSKTPTKSKAAEEAFLSFNSPSSGSGGSGSAAAVNASPPDTDAADMNSDWCDSVGTAALSALSSIVISIGSLLPSDARLLIDTSLVSSLLAVSTPAGYLLLPNLPSSYRLELYRCLLASIQSPTTNDPALLSYAVRLFSAGTRDPVLAIGEFCAAAINTCQLITQPRAPPLLVTTNASNATGSSSGGTAQLNQSFVKHLNALIGMSAQLSNAIASGPVTANDNGASASASAFNQFEPTEFIPRSAAPTPAITSAAVASSVVESPAAPAPAPAPVASESKTPAKGKSKSKAKPKPQSPAAPPAPTPAPAAAASPLQKPAKQSNSKRKRSATAAAPATTAPAAMEVEDGPKLKAVKPSSTDDTAPATPLTEQPEETPASHVASVIDVVAADAEAEPTTAAGGAVDADGDLALESAAAPEDNTPLWSLG